jgi:2-keto-4-pentenoate hydratase
MDAQNAARLNAILSAARAEGVTATLTDSDLPKTLDEAYAIALDGVSAETVSAWKIGGVNPWSHAVFENTEPFYGALWQHEVATTGHAFSLDGLVAPLAEPEICLELGTWPPRADGPLFTRMAIGLEIPATVLPEAIKTCLACQVLDRAGAGGLYIGEAVPFDGDRLAADFLARYRLSGEDWREGRARHVFGGPLGSALLFLGQALHRSAPLRSGQWIATGGLVPAARVETGDRIEAEAAGLSLNLKLT